MDAQVANKEQVQFDPLATLSQKVEILVKSGLGVTEIASQLNKPIGTIGPILSRLRAAQKAFQSGALAQSQSQVKQGDSKQDTSAVSSRPLTEDERARQGALRLLNKVRAGKIGISKERVDAAKAILTKIKASGEDEADKATVYSGMGDEELADHIVTTACASLGVKKLRETLDRLEREGVLIQSSSEVKAGAEYGGA